MEGLEFIGEGMELEEFIHEYMTMFTYSMKTICSIEEFLPREKEYLEAEKKRAELLYLYFEDLNKQRPDYRYMSDSVVSAVIEKEHLFLSRDQNIMCAEHFSEIYIHYLRSEGLLRIDRFSEGDFSYIFCAEVSRAQRHYEEQDEYIEGYESLRIQNNHFLQERLLKQLASEFDSLYFDYVRRD